MSLFPSTVWVIVGKSRKAKPRGFQKTTGRFYLEKEEADRDHAVMEGGELFSVEECVIMSDDEYNQLHWQPF